MEKLLSTTKKQGGKYAGTLKAGLKKILAIAVRATANIFSPTRRQTTKKTTYFRMYYLSQPIAGFIHQMRQLFSGRVIPFYSEIYRLNKWDDLDPYEFIKPVCVAGWTDALIYDRFPKEVLPAIQVLNSTVMGFIRLHKHYQYLTEEGLKMAIKYRNEAIKVMKECASWHEFRLKMTKHGVPYVYQKDMFKEME